jgi:hypothetical protein
MYANFITAGMNNGQPGSTEDTYETYSSLVQVIVDDYARVEISGTGMASASMGYSTLNNHAGASGQSYLPRLKIDLIWDNLVWSSTPVIMADKVGEDGTFEAVTDRTLVINLENGRITSAQWAQTICFVCHCIKSLPEDDGKFDICSNQVDVIDGVNVQFYVAWTGTDEHGRVLESYGIFFGEKIVIMICLLRKRHLEVQKLFQLRKVYYSFNCFFCSSNSLTCPFKMFILTLSFFL